ncbi:MAG TPA: hypothetical protein VHQ24_08230 [Lachnospiraceae bacterium]|nr:hypothetical protein [Lachnospiraceae bacterium]
MKKKLQHKISSFILVTTILCGPSSTYVKAADTNAVTKNVYKSTLTSELSSLEDDKVSSGDIGQANLLQNKYRDKTPTIAHHKVYSSKTISNRIETIRDYYYNKPSKLTTKSSSFTFIDKTYKFTYYLNGKDLMFAYGTQGKNEYRLYFYENQLIQMLVNKMGSSHKKTYTQLYKKLETTWYEETLSFYMDMESYARRVVESTIPKTTKIVTDTDVIITQVYGSKITYHKLYAYGSDGCLWTMDPIPYTATLASNVKIEDYSGSPSEYKSRSVNWLKDASKGFLGCACDLEEKKGKVSKIVCPYWA